MGILNKFFLVLTGICPYYTALYNLTFQFYAKSLALIVLFVFGRAYNRLAKKILCIHISCMNTLPSIFHRTYSKDLEGWVKGCCPLLEQIFLNLFFQLTFCFFQEQMHKVKQIDSKCSVLYDLSIYTAMGEKGMFSLRNVTYPLRI